MVLSRKLFCGTIGEYGNAYLQLKREVKGLKKFILFLILTGAILLAAITPSTVSAETCILTLAAQESPAWNTYHNSRYGFSIEYPASFTSEPPPENNDGRTFVSRDRKATIAVYGNYNVFDDSLESAMKKALEEIKVPIAYKTKGKNWYVISWKEKEMITYIKTYVGKSALNTFLFTCPAAQKERYDSVTAYCEKSFRPGPLD